MKISKYYILFILFVLSFSSCNEKRKTIYTIGFSQCCDDSWRDVMNSEIFRELAFHSNIELELKVADNQSKTQIEQIKELQHQGVDLMIISPNEAEPLTKVVEEVYDSGIPVILIDRTINSEKYTAFIGADNYEIGKMAADYLGNSIKGEGQIIKLYFSYSMSPAVERNKGFEDGIAQYNNLIVVDSIHGDKVIALSPILPDVIQERPDANIIFGFIDNFSEHLYKSAEKAGIEDNYTFVGIDGIPGTGKGIEAVEEGILDASILYPTGGKEVINLALNILENKPFDKKNKLETTVIDKTNAKILNSQFHKVNELQTDIDRQQNLVNRLESIYQNQRNYIILLALGLFSTLILGISLWRSLRAKQLINSDLKRKNEEVTNQQKLLIEQKDLLVEQKEQLIEVSEKLKEATQAKVNFFTNISHEFRTPITLILGFVDNILNTSRLNKNIQQDAQFINDNAYRLLRLVTQLMDFRKIESDKMELFASENDLISFIKDIMASYRQIAKKQDIDFRLITREASLMMWFDTSKMDKVLFNLLSNAFKYTEKQGSIHIIVNIQKENKVIIQVKNSGEIISKKVISHLFEPFFQNKNSYQKGGTGIGLSLSKSLIELHHGTIQVQSDEINGTNFLIELPLGNSHLEKDEMLGEKNVYSINQDNYVKSALESNLPVSEEKTLHTSLNSQILIIEDNEDLQFFLKGKLEQKHHILQAKNGKKGIEQAFTYIPDLIICDVNMPVKNGIEVLKTLKNDLRTSHIPIILLTARSSYKQQIEGMKAGADMYVIKPFNVQYLEEVINTLLINKNLIKEYYSKGLMNLQKNKRQVKDLDEQFIRELTHYIEKHYMNIDFKVKDLTQVLNLSQSQLYRKTKALLGVSINDYLQNIRLKKAEELLRNTDLPITEIAYQVGYSSPKYFSTVFKSHYNMSPSKYRK